MRPSGERPARNGLLLGVDLGTTGVKAVLVDAGSGAVLRRGYARYPTTASGERHEQDPDDWWRATVRAVREARPHGENVLAVGLSGHMHALLLVDGRDRVVRPAMTWADRRSSAQVGRLRASGDGFERRCANPVVEAFTAPKLAWLAEHEPAALRRAVRLVLPKDHLRFQLTGEWSSDVTDAWGTLLYDVHEGCWVPELFEACGASVGLGPQVHRSPEVIGRCRRDAAEQLGLRAGVPVVAGASDVACSALGAGVVSRDVVGVNVGSAAQVTALLPEPVSGPLFVFGRADAPGALAMASVYAVGLSIDWAGAALLDRGDERATGAALDGLAAEADPSGSGPTFVPTLLGTSVPSHDARIRGAFLGLELGHDRAALARSVLEGTACEVLSAVDQVTSVTGAGGQLRIGGGPSRSTVLTSCLAATAGVPVHRLLEDASPLGAAMLAGVGAAVWTDASEAVASCVRTAAVAVPAEDQRERLQRAALAHRSATRAVAAFADLVDEGGQP